MDSNFSHVDFIKFNNTMSVNHSVKKLAKLVKFAVIVDFVDFDN